MVDPYQFYPPNQEDTDLSFLCKRFNSFPTICCSRYYIVYTQVGISGDLKLIKQMINSIMKLFQVNWAYWTEAKSLDVVKYTKQFFQQLS